MFLALAALLVSVTGQVAASVEIPFTYRDGLLWVDVAAPGRSEPLHFLLDSGAEASVLGAGAARRLELKLGRPEAVQGVGGMATARRVRFEGSLGGAALPKSLLVLDLGAASALCHREIEGLIGADFLRGRVVQIDFSAGRLRLLDEARPKVGAAVLPMTTRNGVFCVRVGVAGGSPQWTRVDTGCDSALEWAAGPSGGKQGGASIGLAQGRDHTMQADVQLGPRGIPDVRIGLHDQPIFRGEAGLLGNGLLCAFRVTLDARAHRLILE